MEEKIQDLSEMIYHHKTKEYFEEVMKSYRQENYRSCVVMLYTVVICDLVFKLTDLKEIHGDTKAEKILNDLGVEKENDPVSPQWETNLIKKSFEEAKLIENDLFTHINTLKQYRNLSAHPVLNSMDILYRPNKELAGTLIISMLEGLLTKHPLLTKNVFSPFMTEIERIKNDFSNKQLLKKYLQSKYFVYFNQELVEYIFKNLWKCVFRKNGAFEKNNREINANVLNIIYNEYTDILFQYIQKETSFFSDFLDETPVLKELIDFLSLNPKVFELLEVHAQELLLKRISEKNKWKVKSVFISGSLKKHLEFLGDDFNTAGTHRNHVQPHTQHYIVKRDEIKFLHDLSISNGAVNEFYDFVINQYCHSDTFDTADINFQNCIEPYYINFTKDQIITLLSGIEYNPQCHNGRYAYRNKVLLETAKNVTGDEEIEKKYSKVFE